MEPLTRKRFDRRHDARRCLCIENTHNKRVVQVTFCGRAVCFHRCIYRRHRHRRYTRDHVTGICRASCVVIICVLYTRILYYIRLHTRGTSKKKIFIRRNLKTYTFYSFWVVLQP